MSALDPSIPLAAPSRPHGFYLELVGRSGGPSPWWLAVLLAAGVVAELVGRL